MSRTGVAIALVAITLTASLPVHAQSEGVVVSSDAAIRVWVERSGEVPASYEDIAVSFRPLRDCYATMYVVDTNGSLHMVYPLENGDRAWVRAGVTYRYSAADLGLAEFGIGGITHLFAVGSPHPQEVSSTRVVSTSRTVSESIKEYREKYRHDVQRRAAELASARALAHPDRRSYAKQQRVTNRPESLSKGKPTSTRAAKKTSDSERNEEAKARSASNKAR